MQPQALSESYRPTAGPVQVRPPREKDAAIIHALIENAPELDTNSCYAYLLQGWHYSETCALAEIAGVPAGYVSGFIPPRQPDTLFIWQVVVAPAARGAGVAQAMVLDLLKRESCSDVRYIDSTVAKGNASSERFFHKLAELLQAELSISERLPAVFFRPNAHASERLFRIGPVRHTHDNNHAGA